MRTSQKFRIRWGGFYKKLYQEPKSWRPTIVSLEFECLDESDRLSLERELEALKEAKVDKALGLDVYYGFLLEMLECAGRGCLGFFADFHGQCIFEKSLNATFLCLISKKANIINIKDFLPISFVGGLYKFSG